MGLGILSVPWAAIQLRILSIVRVEAERPLRRSKTKEGSPSAFFPSAVGSRADIARYASTSARNALVELSINRIYPISFGMSRLKKVKTYYECCGSLSNANAAIVLYAGLN